jgi:hypothetical protein
MRALERIAARMGGMARGVLCREGGMGWLGASSGVNWVGLAQNRVVARAAQAGEGSVRGVGAVREGSSRAEVRQDWGRRARRSGSVRVGVSLGSGSGWSGPSRGTRAASRGMVCREDRVGRAGRRDGWERLPAAGGGGRVWCVARHGQAPVGQVRQLVGVGRVWTGSSRGPESGGAWEGPSRGSAGPEMRRVVARVGERWVAVSPALVWTDSGRHVAWFGGDGAGRGSREER